MAKEIEHKYMVRDDSYKSMATGSEEIIQGYIDRTPEHVVRVRRRDERYYLTIKGRNNGDTRLEFEYEIPATDFDGLLSLCVGRILCKRRWLVPFGGFLWEVDEYGGDLPRLRRHLSTAAVHRPQRHRRSQLLQLQSINKVKG